MVENAYVGSMVLNAYGCAHAAVAASEAQEKAAKCLNMEISGRVAELGREPAAAVAAVPIRGRRVGLRDRLSCGRRLGRGVGRRCTWRGAAAAEDHDLQGRGVDVDDYRACRFANGSQTQREHQDRDGRMRAHDSGSSVDLASGRLRTAAAWRLPAGADVRLRYQIQGRGIPAQPPTFVGGVSVRGRYRSPRTRAPVS